MEVKLYDIVIFRGKVVQIIQLLDLTCVIWDVHTKKEPILISLIDKVADADQIKWFCENTEAIDFNTPIQKIKLK